MKVKVLRPFIDKYDTKQTYYLGDTVEGFSESRIKELTEKGFVKALEKSKKTKDDE
ncbi:MAG: hypothetical protein LBL13_06985 [Bacteroidales bacterium]|jgi:hypothetical protein|nr:hypothetical protein [Bacteroidales bacterium]